MKNLIFIACCNIYKVVIDILKVNGSYDEYTIVGFIDDNKELTGKSVDGIEVLGTLNDLDEIIELHKVTDVVICLPEGYVNRRKECYDICIRKGLRVPNLIHPTSVIAKDVKLGNGIICCANSAVNSGSTIGDDVIIWTGTTVDHDNQIGDHVYISPGAHLAGGVKVSERVMIGTGAIITPLVSIGSNVNIGAASLVNKNVPDNVTVYGTPAKVIKKTRSLT